MTTIEVSTKEQLTTSLYEHLREFEHAQNAVKNRIQDIRNGKLTNNRIPTKKLVEHRNIARTSMQDFLDHLSDDENAVLTIMWGKSDWRRKYDDIMSPKNDPAV